RHRLALCRARLPAVPAAGRRCGMTRLLLTVPEAAESLAISRSKLYELIAAGLIGQSALTGPAAFPSKRSKATSLNCSTNKRSLVPKLRDGVIKRGGSWA